MRSSDFNNIDDDQQLFGSEEQQFLDNVSWDTSSDEEDHETDKKIVAESRLAGPGTFNQVAGDSDSEFDGRKWHGNDTDYYDFYFHDFKKTYFEPTKEYIRYGDMQKFKVAEEQDLSDDDSQASLKKEVFDLMDEFLGADKCDSFNFELQEREAYDTHKVEFDKKTFHMNERKKIFEKKDGG